MYDQKIGDLLDPTQRDLEVSIISLFISCKNVIDFSIPMSFCLKLRSSWFFILPLQIKDDVKNGFYVENLTEEYVTCYEDITQILIKVAERGEGLLRGYHSNI